jgi:hypothetical protein
MRERLRNKTAKGRAIQLQNTTGFNLLGDFDFDALPAGASRIL